MATRTHTSAIYVLQETERLVADPAPGIAALPHDDNLRYFDVTIEGPGGSPFESKDTSYYHQDSCNQLLPNTRGTVQAGAFPT